MKKKHNKLLIILLVIIVLLVFMVLYLFLGFERRDFSDGKAPGSTYYCHVSKVTGLYYCKVVAGCSAIDCSSSKSYKIYKADYFNYIRR